MLAIHLNPGARRSLGEGNGYLLQYSWATDTFTYTLWYLPNCEFFIHAHFPQSATEREVSWKQSNKMLAEQCPLRHFICGNSFSFSPLLRVPLSYFAPRKPFFKSELYNYIPFSWWMCESIIAESKFKYNKEITSAQAGVLSFPKLIFLFWKQSIWALGEIQRLYEPHTSLMLESSLSSFCQI